MGHVVDAVDRRDEVDRSIAGQRLAARVDEAGIAHAALAASRLGALQRVLRDVVADEPALGKRFGHHQHCAPGAAPDVGDIGACVQTIDHTVDCRQHGRNEMRAVPRLETAFDADGATLAMAVVIMAESRAERLWHRLQGGDGLGKSVKHPHPEGRMIRVGEDRHRRGRQAETIVASRRVDLDQLCRSLVVQPLTHPSLVETGRGRQLRRCVRVRGVGQRAVQAQSVTEVDHPRRDGTGELGEHVKGHERDLIGRRSGLHALDDRRSAVYATHRERVRSEPLGSVGRRERLPERGGGRVPGSDRPVRGSISQWTRLDGRRRRRRASHGRPARGQRVRCRACPCDAPTSAR